VIIILLDGVHVELDVASPGVVEHKACGCRQYWQTTEFLADGMAIVQRLWQLLFEIYRSVTAVYKFWCPA